MSFSVLLKQVQSPQSGTQNSFSGNKPYFLLLFGSGMFLKDSHIEYLVLNVTMFKDETFGRRVWVPRTLTSLADWPVHRFIVGWTIPRWWGLRRPSWKKWVLGAVLWWLHLLPGSFFPLFLCFLEVMKEQSRGFILSSPWYAAFPQALSNSSSKPQAFESSETSHCFYKLVFFPYFLLSLENWLTSDSLVSHDQNLRLLYLSVWPFC